MGALLNGLTDAILLFFCACVQTPFLLQSGSRVAG
jgi:hypothetical protein